jgi:hypothetical protein
MAREVSAPLSVINTDEAGRNTAKVATVPPTSGVDYGLPVYANLGSAVISVAPSSVGVALQSTNQVSVGTGATQIVAANASRAAIVISNPSASVTVFLGKDNTVTISNGHGLLPGNSITLPVVGTVFGIVAAATQTVTYAEVQ